MVSGQWALECIEILHGWAIIGDTNIRGHRPPKFSPGIRVYMICDTLICDTDQ